MFSTLYYLFRQNLCHNQSKKVETQKSGWWSGGGEGLTGQGKKKEPRDGKWSTSNPKVDNLNGFVDMTGTLLKLGSDNTYLD